MPLTKVTSSLITTVSASQIQAAGESAGKILTYDGSTSTWAASTISVSASQIQAAGASAGKIITYDGSTSTWVASAAPTASVGAGQTWSGFGTSRALGTDYANNTGRPIMVSVTGSGTLANASNTLQMYVNSVNIGTGGNYGLGSLANVTFIVPAGATYRVTGSSSEKHTWYELR